MASQAVKERDRLDSQDLGLSGSVTADDSDVAEEDSEGNKYAGRIIKSVERQFRRDGCSLNHTPNSAT
ncbi:hypothetical protein PI124_g21137 [Phytophthora idaei]|nr:hypothetical protein PI125_g24200 [Phytophthora idaei]KAG3129667.1 hypothetical protein PI126_g20856 [Phytophthora idaei]KAG3233795.1 hypothetical protein PI124_g21137 [Phytophthora idaei]